MRKCKLWFLPHVIHKINFKLIKTIYVKLSFEASRRKHRKYVNVDTDFLDMENTKPKKKKIWVSFKLEQLCIKIFRGRPQIGRIFAIHICDKSIITRICSNLIKIYLSIKRPYHHIFSNDLKIIPKERVNGWPAHGNVLILVHPLDMKPSWPTIPLPVVLCSLTSLSRLLPLSGSSTCQVFKGLPPC